MVEALCTRSLEDWPVLEILGFWLFGSPLNPSDLKNPVVLKVAGVDIHPMEIL